jgi:hypothetical protein
MSGTSSTLASRRDLQVAPFVLHFSCVQRHEQVPSTMDVHSAMGSRLALEEAISSEKKRKDGDRFFIFFPSSFTQKLTRHMTSVKASVIFEQAISRPPDCSWLKVRNNKWPRKNANGHSRPSDGTKFRAATHL